MVSYVEYLTQGRLGSAPCCAPALLLPSLTSLPWFVPDPKCPFQEWARLLEGWGLALDHWYLALYPQCYPVFHWCPQVLSSLGLSSLTCISPLYLCSGERRPQPVFCSWQVPWWVSGKPSSWAASTTQEFRALTEELDVDLGMTFMRRCSEMEPAPEIQVYISHITK